MEEWKTYKLGDLVNVLDYKRIPLSSKERENRQGIYPYYGAQGIIDYIDDYIFDGSYLLVAEDGENVRSQKDPIAQIAKGKYWVNNHAHILESNGKCDIRYICYTLNNLDISGYITGSAQPKLNQANLLSILVTIPSLSEQISIADFLSKFDTKIELNNRINHNLEEQAQALYKSWFIDFEPFKDGEFVESELGMLPRSWRVGNLSELIDIRYGKDHKKLHDGPYSVYGSGGFMRKVERPLFEGESVLIPRKGTLNNVMYVNEAFWSVDTMFYSVEKMPNIVKYCYQILSQLDLASMNSGSAVPSMTTDILNSIQVVIPDKEVLENYNIILSHIFDLAASIRNVNSCLISIRNSILPKLMNGEIVC